MTEAPASAREKQRGRIINGAVLPRYAAPAASAPTSDARVSGHLQLLRRVRLRGRAFRLQADCDSMPRRFFGHPSSQQHGRSDWGGWPARCSYGSSSDGDGAAAANFDASGEEFVDSSIIEAVELRSVSDGFVIKMRDGKDLRCVQNNPRVLRLRDSAPHHAIVLKMEDGSDLLLPIIPRPTIYNVLIEMTKRMGYENGNEEDTISFDLKPSDAINIAFRCKRIAYNNGLKVVQPKRALAESFVGSDDIQITRLDRPDDQPCGEAQEFDLVRNMLIAAVEERYKDAAQYRDQLFMLRSKKKSAI
nr:unnamed protein product [Digitaria exilis]